ncbi:orotate phosphoribosyltransferase [Fluviispira sanaruensis]|uniref:Orotate phosphoribosyltransferase n=1 Tax=Fluviispira sanaruensis TaxID=2493639 RepID=A0A4P2VLG7_FLUSA|nr:phosphoribosyltransferase family protein [Fluviispira sanaruensis]BBH53498.1 orotate phosphoribosyltransferase [Fluviispira sanaruensis]
MILNSDIQEIIQGFFEAKVIQIKTNPMFKLTSGKESPVYIDHRKIFSHPQLRRKVIKALAESLLAQYAKQFSQDNVVFAGTATAGIAPAYALADYFNSGFVYVRSKAKAYGLNSVIEGFIPSEAHVIVVDDMVTTGGSILQACEHVRNDGFQILTAVSLSQHSLKKMIEKFTLANVSLHSLFKTTDIFDIAYGKNLITGREMKLIMEWLTQLDE